MGNKLSAEKVFQTDVLVIGGSGAGSMAAVTAASKGSKVILAVKGKLGKSGNAIMAGAGFSMDGETDYKVYGNTMADPKDTKDMLFERIVKQSFYLSDQNLVEQFTEDNGICCDMLKGWIERAGHKVIYFPKEGYITSGRSVTDGCRKGVCETEGIEVIEDFMAVDVIMKEGRAAGAVGIFIYTGEIAVIKAKSVIIATGGYQPYSFKCTVSDMTGDGMAMAYRAGAKLADMEFLLYIPAVSLSPSVYKGSIFPFLHTAMFKPVVKNGLGESITDKIPEKMKKLADESEMNKLIYTYYYGKDIFDGKGTENGGVYFDYSHIPADVYKGTIEKYMPMMKAWYKEGCFQGNSLDIYVEKAIKGEPWEIGLGCEYSMGGIEIDERMSTGIPGLYAAGETTSGVFGAMRVADGLIEMLVHGYRAGQSAAEYAEKADHIENLEDVAEQLIQEILKPFGKAGGISPVKVRRGIEKAADEGFNFRRNEKCLTKALKEIEGIRDNEIQDMSMKSANRAYNMEWIEGIQSRNLIICTEAGIRAALMRKESRGTHIRDDYEYVDNDNFLIRIESYKGLDGSIKLTSRKPVVTKIKPPTGKYKSIPDYLLSI